MRPKKTRPDFKYNFPDLFQEILLEPVPNIQLHALWFKSTTLPPRGVILYFHGNAGNLERWGEVGPRFTEMGIDIIIPDYRGFGKSTGKIISEKEMVEDGQFMLDYVKSQYGEIPLFLFGRSIGSGIACSLIQKIKCSGLILETPFTGMDKLFFTYYPFLPRLFWFRFTFSNLEKVKQCMLPILIFAGTKDWVVPYRNSKVFKSVLKPSDTFVTLKGGGHFHLFQFEEYQEEMAAWFKKVIP